jgi:hypothetical protein
MNDKRTLGEMTEHYFKLKKPCANCPFRIKGAIDLRPGRVQGIIDDLLGNDYSGFPCHKTTGRGQEIEDEDGEITYQPTGEERMCAGAAALLMKRGQPSVGMRMAFAFGTATPNDWDEIKPLIID